MTEEERIERNKRVVAQHRAVDGLIGRFSERMTDDRLEHLQEASRVGEWGFALEFLCAWLVECQISVTLEEQEAVGAVLGMFSTRPGKYRYFDDIPATLAALNVTER